MELNDLSPSITVSQIEALYKKQFAESISVNKLTLKESRSVLYRTHQMIKEYKNTSTAYYSETSPTYLKLRMVSEAISKRIANLVESYADQINSGTRTMTPKYVTALRAVAAGKKLNESQINSLNVSRGLKRILESQKLAVGFMRKIVETKSRNSAPLMEGEIDTAQTILAAQDIADQIQTMIEKFSDIQYKELPALHDSIRNSQGVAEAEQFNSALLDSLSQITQSLETAKSDVNNAVAGLTGEEISPSGELGDELGGDLDLDDELGDTADLGDKDPDLGDEFDVSFEKEDPEESKFGRVRR